MNIFFMEFLGTLQHSFMSESFWLVLVLQLAPLGKILATSLFKNRLNKREKTQDKPKKEKIKPEIISSKPASAESVKIDNPNKAEKAEKPKKAEKAEKPKKAEKPQKEQGSNLFKSGASGGLPDYRYLMMLIILD
jgi:hypothetical protein